MEINLNVERLTSENAALSEELGRYISDEARLLEVQKQCDNKLQTALGTKQECMGALDEWRLYAAEKDTELAALREEFSDFDETLKRKNGELDVQSRAAESALGKLKEETKKAADAERMYDAARTELAQSTEKLEKSLAESSELRQAVETIKESATLAQSSEAGLKRELEKVRQQLASALEEVGSCESLRRKVSSENTTLQASVKSLQEASVTLTKEFTLVKSKLDSQEASEQVFYTFDAYKRDLRRLRTVGEVFVEHATGKPFSVQQTLNLAMEESRRLATRATVFFRAQRDILSFILQPYLLAAQNTYQQYLSEFVAVALATLTPLLHNPSVETVLLQFKAHSSNMDWGAIAAEAQIMYDEARIAVTPILQHITKPLKDPRIAAHFSLAPLDIYYTGIFLVCLLWMLRNQVKFYLGVTLFVIGKVLATVRAALWLVKSILLFPFRVTCGLCSVCFRRRTADTSKTAKKAPKRNKNKNKSH